MAKIGKFTLESLTTGMYDNPKILYREYVQNSTDAIDRAINFGWLKNRDDGRIDITVDKKNKKIIIRDNGSGIPESEVYDTLINVGDSQKKHDENRGFRGIGRLGGISYCDSLVFVTSSKGESTKSILTWDCKKFKKLIVPGVANDMDSGQLIEVVTDIKYDKEEKNSHYFEVNLVNVDDKQTELLDDKIIIDYLREVCPIPFNPMEFYYYNDTQEGFKYKLNEIGKPLEEYNIYVNCKGDRLYKHYKSWVTTGRNGQKDDVKRIEYFYDYKEDGRIRCYGWYGVTDFKGYIKDKKVSGLRFRKNNILIGDGNTLRPFFTEDRFNTYFIGEIYVYDEDIIPNARRDNFEENEAFFKFKSSFLKITKHKLSKLPRIYSDYNSAKRSIEKINTQINEIQKKVEGGFSSNAEKQNIRESYEDLKVKKNETQKKLNKAKNKIDNSSQNDKDNSNNTAMNKNSIEDQIEKKINEGKYSIDINDLLSGQPRKVRSAIMQVFEKLDSKCYGKCQIVDDLKKDIINALSNGKYN